VSEPTHAPSLRRFSVPSIREAVRAHWFAIGVFGIALAAGSFLVHQLLAWPPHEDETLALFVGRDSLGGVFHHVTRDRGGAPLHFVLAWAVAQLELGLTGLRVVSAAFAVASLPLIALLGKRLAGAAAGLLCTLLVATSWAFLFHGVYGRMYSLVLFLSTLTLLALLRALEVSTVTRWALWALAMLATVSAHPYGALVLGAQGLFVLIDRRDRLRPAAVAFAALAVAATPFWLTDLVLARRFDAGVSGDGQLGGPASVLAYLWESAGDFTTGWWPLLVGVLALVVVGATRATRELRHFALAMVGFPTIAFLTARFGGSGTPESRHLIFLLPVLALLVAIGLLAVASRSRALGVAIAVTLVATQVMWAWHRTPALFDWEPEARHAARAAAAGWLAGTSRPDDVLFGYNPLFLQAWELDDRFPHTVVPRADPTLALRVLERGQPRLGRGVWVLDRSDPRDLDGTLTIQLQAPSPAHDFDVRRFGPFLVIRTREATGTPEVFLRQAAAVAILGVRLDIGEAPRNLSTIEQADRLRRGYPPDSPAPPAEFR
jgi:hypothetical protein